MKMNPVNFSVNDCVHGDITLPGYTTAIIESPQFQRLKSIQQLGEFDLIAYENLPCILVHLQLRHVVKSEILKFFFFFPSFLFSLGQVHPRTCSNMQRTTVPNIASALLISA